MSWIFNYFLKNKFLIKFVLRLIITNRHSITTEWKPLRYKILAQYYFIFQFMSTSQLSLTMIKINTVGPPKLKFFLAGKNLINTIIIIINQKYEYAQSWHFSIFTLPPPPHKFCFWLPRIFPSKKAIQNKKYIKKNLFWCVSAKIPPLSCALFSSPPNLFRSLQRSRVKNLSFCFYSH